MISFQMYEVAREQQADRLHAADRERLIRSLRSPRAKHVSFQTRWQRELIRIGARLVVLGYWLQGRVISQEGLETESILGSRPAC